MLKSNVVRSIALVSLCMLFLVIPFVKGDESTESFIVYTDKEEYLVGESVNIYVKAEAIDPGETITVTDVVVYDPANVSVAEWHDLSIVLVETTTPAYVETTIAESEGNYTVSAEATGCWWRLWAKCWFKCCHWHHKVIPEVPFGTIIAMITFLGATGLYTVHRKPKNKKKWLAGASK